ncbi:class I SAM-dependent methyltransferase [Pseudonocardia aurantiaca]|uniref:Class I SAM-dependent methyltransferase n=1 Tax=Pseudonocardia aurantiaca TaxID=75290 RepID=A0ABW4FQG2_9PSEU
MTTDRLRALLAPEGQEILEFLRGQDVTGPDALRLGTELRARYPAQLVADAMGQQELRMRAAAKFAQAQDMFFTRPGLEQASAEVVARHRAARYVGAESVADLCCGIGGDLLALAGGSRVLAVDRDPVHLWMAEQNARAYGLGDAVSTLDADVRAAAIESVDAVFIDPARRSPRGRMRTGESEPPLEWCVDLAERVAAVGVKAAPGIPHDDVPSGWELEFVSVDRDLKEAAAWSPALATARARATLLPGGHTLVDTRGDPVPVREPGAFLLDPDPAVTRAGVVEELARRVGAWKIDDRIAFLSADEPVSTPFARTLRVIDSAPWNQKRLPQKLRALDVGAVDIRRRGLAGDVDALHRRLKLSGSRRATLVMTRVRDQPWGFVCVTPDTA